MQQLALFHSLAGKPVIVLGEGEMAEPKRRLVERAGARVVTDLQQGVDEGARLAFVAHDDAAMCEGDAIRLRCAGLIVNVVDRPDLCDFTTPSILDREPVLVAIGTGGASATLAKQLRLRLERLLPADLGALATRLLETRDAIKDRFPEIGDRRRALDEALGEGGSLDPLADGGAERVECWLDSMAVGRQAQVYDFTIQSDDPDELTVRQSRLLGSADAVLAETGIAQSVLDRARADAERYALPHSGPLPSGLVVRLYRA